ncbi:zf-HC2 domain-containing protein [Kitasatospora sp. NPDC018619]|uniref:zf-HC2 domain-containing protein n=1 Tax=unclassified Kitasatospora TaxID=2633591 RepID=UPI00379B1D0B
MNGEHASRRLIDDYARGDTPMAADTVWALEAHLEACAPCRSHLAAAVAAEAPEVTALLATVRTGLEPQLAAAVRAPARRRPRWAAAWLTPAAAPWLATTALLALLGVLLDTVGASTSFLDASPVSAVAPVLPLCGAAAAWSRGLDPAHELTASTARAGLPLLLRRTTAALLAVLPVLLVGGWLTGTLTAAQWLLPSLAFTSTALALGSAVGVTRAAAGLLAVWGVAVVAPAWTTGHAPAVLRFVLDPDRSAAWAALVLLATGAVIARRNTYPTL